MKETPVNTIEDKIASRVHRLRILDTDPEPVFDNLVSIAAEITSAPIAFISFLDYDRIWLKAKIGIANLESSRASAFCMKTISAEKTLVIEDAANDPMHFDHPMVLGSPFVRGYIGVPLKLSEGSSVGVICIADPSPRKFTKSQIQCLELLAKQVTYQLEAREKALKRSDFVAEVCHEINSPLTTIVGRAGQLIEMAEQNHFQNDKVKGIARLIENTGLRISKIISSLRADGNDEKLEVVSISAALEDTIEIYRQRFSENGIRFEILIPQKTILVPCRTVEISQVLVNLLNNAFDAIQSNKEKWVRLEMSVTAGYCEIAVTDSGTMISHSLIQKIMEPFFTTKPIGKGTGIGLSISQRLVDLHGGKLFVDETSPNMKVVIQLPLLGNPNHSSN